MKHHPRLLLAAATLVAASSAHALTATKTGTDTDLTATSTTAWTGGSGANGSPTDVDVATWTTGSLGAGLTAATDVTWGSISVLATNPSDIDISGAGKITTGNITLAGTKTLSIANDIVLSGNATYNLANVNGTAAPDATLSGVISGAFGITKSGAGTLVLSGANTYSGGTTIQGSTSSISVSNIGNTADTSSALGTGQVVFQGGALIYTGVGETTNKVFNVTSTALGAGGGITNNGTGLLEFTSAFASTSATADYGLFLSGSGDIKMVGITPPSGRAINFNKTGAGTLTVTGLVNTRRVSANGNFNVNGGTLVFAATSSTGTGADAAGIARNATLGGVLKIESGAQVHTRTNNTNGILGGWAVFGGNTWASSSATASTTPVLVTGLSTYDTSNTWAAAANMDITADNTTGAAASVNSLRFNTAAPVTQTLSGATNITSGGILVTSNVGANDVTITGGTSLGSPGGSVTVHQNNTAGSLIINSVIAGASVTLTKSGAGTLTLGAANSYVGATFINEGTLLVNGSTGAGAVTVSNSAKLGGTGTVGGATTTVYGTIRGGTGVDASGTLAVTGNITLAAGSVIELALGAGGARSTLAFNGTESFQTNQVFSFLNFGAEVGTYENLISGVTVNPNTTGTWTISNAGYVGTFSWDGANIDLNLTAVPEPSTYGLIGAGVLASAAFVRRRRKLAGKAA